MSTQEILRKYAPERDQLLLMLHEIQRNNAGNNITQADIRQVADYLHTTSASIYGVVRYYSMFSLSPRGKYVIRFCKSPLCRMVGAFNLLKFVEKELSVRMGETTGDMLFTLEPSECLGHCDKAPVMMINEKMYFSLDESRVQDILNQIRQKELKTQQP